MRTVTPAVMTDLYQLTMAAGYWSAGRQERAVFELFARRLPEDRSYLVVAGIEDALRYLQAFRFTREDVASLRELPAFSGAPPAFCDSLEALRFTGDVWAMREGTLAFPHEPILVVEAPIIQAQIVETALLSLLNYPTSVTTKAARIVTAARGAQVIEFGARRAHGSDAALIAARAAYIGGCAGTSNVEAALRFGLPVYGTIAHSWVMSYEDEIEAFRAYQRVFPHTAVFLIDTYDTLRAARRITENFRPHEVAAVRLDSGDLAEMARGVRAIFDAAGFTSTRILASGDLDERLIAGLVERGAPIDAYGVGTELTTVRDAPALSGVYKLVEIRRDGQRKFKLKLSPDKATYPGQKQVWRHSGPDGRYGGDTVTLFDEPPPAGDCTPLLEPVMRDGKLLADPPRLAELRGGALSSLERLPAPYLALDPPPEPYPARFSDRIRAIRNELRNLYSS